MDLGRALVKRTSPRSRPAEAVRSCVEGFATAVAATPLSR